MQHICVCDFFSKIHQRVCAMVNGRGNSAGFVTGFALEPIKILLLSCRAFGELMS